MARIKKLSHDETAYICEQLSLIINAGIPLSEGAEMIAQSAGDNTVTNVAKALQSQINDGKTLFEAMESSGAFPQYAVNMVRIGTLSGRLDDVLKGLASYYEDLADRLRNMRSAILHPFILIAMMTAVMIVLIVQVIPMFSEIFGQFDSSIGTVVKASVDYAYSTGTVILIILVSVLAVSAVIALLSKIPKVRNGLSAFAAKFILTRKAASYFSQAKFASAMSMMVSSGIEASEALDNAMLLITDKSMLSRMEKCRNQVIEGEPFADALNDAKLLPPIYSRSLKMAYKSGAFDDAWKKISDKCTDEANATSENLVSFIEPVLIAVMAVMIGAILLTVMLPMMDIMSVLG